MPLTNLNWLDHMIMTCRKFVSSVAEKSSHLYELSPFEVHLKMNITSRTRTRIITLSQHTCMTIRDIAATVGFEKSIVYRIINKQAWRFSRKPTKNR
ncbi:hypothetical protein TNCV_3518311 [Trichonephila clavipes]|uniref:Uncharacterized protein n=1 Tax=Trichonephila clavipes TaxID=2585209 RepID=A0A8X6SPF7_TRICX|nr:hypothetical protein TNCV_3518311 [Trichonephila clavipes]